MRGLSVLLAVVAVVVLGMAVLIRQPTTVAQAATPTSMAAMAQHPVVGMWEMTGQDWDETFPFLAIFHADGTYLAIYPWGRIFFGVWKSTGARTAEGTTVGYEVVDDRLVRGEGRWSAQVDETGNAIATDGYFVARYVDEGTLHWVIEGPAPGTRVEVLPVVPLADLVPGGAGIPLELTGATPTP